MLQTSCRIQAVKEHSSAEVQNEIVILHQGEGVYYGLNATGAVIWRELSTPQTVEALVGVVTKQFDVSVETASKDVQAIVGELLQRKLVEVLPE